MRNTVLSVCAVLCLTSYVACSDIVFTSTPSTIRQLVTDDLTLRCALKDSAPSVVIGKRHILSDVTSDTAPSDVSFVHSIVITKAGVDLATVSEHVTAQVFDNTSGVQVTGQIPASGDEKGFLEVSWKYPGSGQSGSYQCVIIGMTQSGHDHTFSQALDVAETEVSLNDVVGYIHQLKLTNDKQNATITGMIASNAGMNSCSCLNTTIADLKVQVNDLKTSNADLKTRLDTLDTHVIFTAILSTSAKTGGVVVFDQLKTSVGGGYNVSTGVFTCPVAGYYVFDLHVTGMEDKYVEANIRHNGNTVTSAVVDDGFDYNSASTSASMKLQRGDTVDVYSSYATNMWGHRIGFSSFSGYLIAVA